MGTTLTALTSDTGVAIQIVAAVEGVPWLLTDGSASAAVTAWAATDWTAALSGAEFDIGHDQRLHPWEPYKTSSSSASISVMDASGTDADTFGLLAFNRENLSSTRLTADLLPGDTTINVQSTSSWSGTSGFVYIGDETIKFESVTGTTFGTLTRGYYSPFAMEGGARFERTHRYSATVPGIPTDATISTTVASGPIDWRGRWVGIWAHRNLGGVLDTKAQAHLLFAGKLATVRDAADGRTVLRIDEVRDAIGDAVILREQFRASIRPTIRLLTGTRFEAKTNRHTVGGVLTTGVTNALEVVASGAVAPNEINEATYAADEVASLINDWLASEKNAGRLIFTMNFSAADSDPTGAVRSSLRWDDSSAADASRRVSIGTNHDEVWRFFGWGDSLLAEDYVGTVHSGTIWSPEEPKQLSLAGGWTMTLSLTAAEGSYVDQATLLSPPIGLGGTGVIRIGEALFACQTPSITDGEGTIDIVAAPLNASVGADLSSGEGWAHPVSADGLIPIEQVLFLTAPAKSLYLTLLASTGGGGNWAAYDLLPDHCSAAIPYELMGTGLEAELTAAPLGGDAMTIVVDRPSKLIDLLNVSTVLRSFQFVWRQGRLAARGFATPTSTATLAIVADDRATPVDTADDMSAVTEERDDLLRNVFKIRHGADAYGENFTHTTNLVDPGAAANYGARPVTLDARNAVRGTGIAGEDIGALLPMFAASLTFLARPQIVIRVPIPHTMFETATAGEVCLFTDGFARDPATGRRGIAARPALIVANRYDWGGQDRPASGDVDLMIFTRLSLAKYCPCAQVASYNAGTKTITCEAHEHSEAGAAADASYLQTAGMGIRVMQIDPDAAGAPLTWDDVVVSGSGNDIVITTGLAGFDATKKYRVYSDDYGDATTAQRANTYQADDADGMVADTRAPYGLAWSPIGQVTSFTVADPSTELPSRPATAASGDAVALDTGHARDLARGINSIVSYHGPQQPQQNNASATYSGAGTWTFVHIQPVYLGIGVPTTDRTRKLYVGPTVSKSGAASADIRVTLAQNRPRTADPATPSRDDIIRVPPYEEHTFTTTSATRVTESAVGLDTAHLFSGHNVTPGIGWLYVEVANHATFYGIGASETGPLEAP